MVYQQDDQNHQSAPYGHHYRTYSSTYYNAENHDQGPVSPVVTSQSDHFSSSHLSAAHRSSLVSPIGTDFPHDGYAAALDGRDVNSPAPEVSPVMSRSGSVASDQFSNVSGLTAATATIPSTPQNVRPAPAYIAPFGAVQVVSEYQAAQRSAEEDETKDDIKISDTALILVNSFLDQLLYSILSYARSTNLSQLKPAILDVLRQRLGRAAIASADEDLRELLAENDEEEESNTQHNSGDRNAQWDLELVWKRTRLRVMVYMRLGELEDEDEDRYIKEEELLHGSERRFSQSTGLVSWAAAIFLTAILEYIAEQTLQVAGRATFTRVRRSSRVQRGGGLLTNALVVHDPIVVEEHDVEKVALDSVLGRPWRTWRKAMRNSAGAASYAERPSASRDSEDVVSRQSSFKSAVNYVLPRRNSLLAGPSQAIDFEPDLDHPEYVLASNIPLPLSTRDVDEIEVPGLARDPDAEDLPPPIPLKSSRRRRTLTDMPPLELMGDLPAPVIDSDAVVSPTSPSKPPLVRRRSASAPTPAAALIPIADMPNRDVPTGETPTETLPDEDLPTEDMPGAFPIEEQNQVDRAPESGDQEGDAPPTIVTDPEDPPEPKANAAEMAQYKRLSQMPSELKSEVQPDPQEKVATAPAELEPTRPDSENDHPIASEEAERQTLFGAAIAGASAVVAATATAVSTALGSTESKGGKELDDAHGSADTNSEEPLAEQKSSVDMEAAADAPKSSTQPPSVAGSSSTAASRRVSPNRVEPPPSGVNKRETSPDSYTLGGEETVVNPVPSSQPKKRLSMSGNMLSASARVRDSIGAGRMSLDRTQSSSPAISDAEQQARGASRRSSRLYLGSMLEDTPSKGDLHLSESPTQSTSPAYLSDESAEQALVHSSRNDSGEHMDVTKSLQSVEEARSSLAQPPGRRSSVPGSALTGSLNTVSVPEKSSRRQSRNAALDKLEGRVNVENETTSNPTGSSSLASFGFDAPRSRLALGAMVDGQYASGQGTNGVSTAWSDNAGSVVPTEMAGLTSASIRGPEDFDLFVVPIRMSSFHLW
nr:hypothetical protein CFP56_21189 [Quercus suber]